jgi:GNAT superfamily N-acetyltransferase
MQSSTTGGSDAATDRRLTARLTIREANARDLEMILHHRRSMFRDMGEGTVEELDRMVGAARPLFAKALENGSYRHWLAIDERGHVAGGGGVLLCPWPANPREACTERAMILNVYTELEFRRRGVARQVMQVILDWIKTRGLASVNLHASDQGRYLYESMGFKPTNEMRMSLADIG